MAWLALATQAAGTLAQSYGQLSSAHAAADAAKYNSAVALKNSEQSLQNSRFAAEAGEAKMEQQGLKTRAEIGNTIANQAASGVDVHSGSAADVQASERVLGTMDAINVRGNAVKEAYGYQVQAAGEKGQADLDAQEAKKDIQAGQIGMIGSLLSGTGSSGNSYYQYKMAGALT